MEGFGLEWLIDHFPPQRVRVGCSDFNLNQLPGKFCGTLEIGGAILLGAAGPLAMPRLAGTFYQEVAHASDFCLVPLQSDFCLEGLQGDQAPSLDRVGNLGVELRRFGSGTI